MRQVTMVMRDTCFSPNSEENDKAVLMAVKQKIEQRGFGVKVVMEDEQGAALALAHDAQTGLFLSMGRHRATLAYLKEQERKGRRVVNSPYGVELCLQRRRIDALMREHAIPAAPVQGSDGFWLKRGDAHSMTPDDVVFAADAVECDEARKRFQRRGVDDVFVTAHVCGDEVKFYGVQGTGFFRCYYPADDGVTKFGGERRNAVAHHYPFNHDRMAAEAERLSRLSHTQVYGGDAVVRADGSFCIIDFNDWPSFSRCRDEAADAIVESVLLHAAT